MPIGPEAAAAVHTAPARAIVTRRRLGDLMPVIRATVMPLGHPWFVAFCADSERFRQSPGLTWVKCPIAVRVLAQPASPLIADEIRPESRWPEASESLVALL